MACAKNYENVSTFVKVMQRDNCGLFFSGHGVAQTDYMYNTSYTHKFRFVNVMRLQSFHVTYLCQNVAM